MNDQNKRIFLRSQEWFDDPEHADMTALYVERYMNYGLTRAELQSGRPIIGIAQTGSDLTPWRYSMTNAGISLNVTVRITSFSKSIFDSISYYLLIEHLARKLSFQFKI